ncbi:hypothetical protein SteCoe_30517 [Stentor coeruleus]|uniref:Cyclic nucleotide-binding domain-containing protein n=1 Tax=Stentor coeruleus TaxID=5963 RepID=A0A1R2B3J2_9CILI|nr:hypothetical protein SteCoe_30517 [Stentor coeruleus]
MKQEHIFKFMPHTTNGLDETFVVTDYTSKYKSIWERVRFKIKVRLMLNKILLAAIGSQTETIDEKKKESDLKNTYNYSGFVTMNPSDFPWHIIHPENKNLAAWNAFIGVSIIYSALVMPFFIAFYNSNFSNPITIMDYIFSFVYFFDFCLQCSTAYYDINGVIILSRWKIFVKYSKTWMIIDLLAFMPFESLDFSHSSGNTKINPLFKLARLPRLYKLFKISKVLKCLKQSNRYGIMMKLQDIFTIRHSIMRLLTTIFTITILLHIAACLWYFVAKIEDFNDQTWVFRGGYMNNDISTLYVTGLYWAFTTFSSVGYGDIYAVTNSEMIFAMIWMLFSVNFLGFTISSLFGFLNKLDTRDKILLSKLAIIDEFSNEAGLPKSMRLKLRNALRHSSSISGFSLSEKYSILAELPKPLRYEVALAMHRGAAKHLEFFALKDTVIISAIIPYLTPVYVNSEQFVYSYMDFPDELYFIIKGKVNYIHPDGAYTIFTIRKKDYFGDIELMLKIPRKYDAVTRMHTELLSLSRFLLISIKKNYENIWFEMKGVAIQRERILLQNYNSIKEEEMNKRKGIITKSAFLKSMKLKKDMDKIRRNAKVNFENEICALDITDKIEEVQERIFTLRNCIKRAKEWQETQDFLL